jgi:predicted RecA/RadA family phage recombinase
VASTVSVGYRVDYTPSSAVAVGAVVVLNKLVGIADRPLPANQLGALAISGIFLMPKATTASSALSVGTQVYWDATNSVVTATASGNTYVGKVVAAAVDGDSTVRVLLVP